MSGHRPFSDLTKDFAPERQARVAEKVATVDILSHGRVEWGTGRSTPMEHARSNPIWLRSFGMPSIGPGPPA